MGLDFSTIVSDLVNQVKGLFGGQQQFNAPHSARPGGHSTGPETVIPAGGFTSPIHDDWMTSGTFSHSATDPNHPHGHLGVDMGAPEGTPVYAFSPGIVTTVGTDGSGGNVAWVKHAGDIFSYYAHMSTVKVQKGDKVDSNTVIGTVGNTGNARRGWPHLHFSVTKGIQSMSAAVDPAQYIKVPPYNPDYGRNPAKYQARYTSDQAKQDAQAFNMQEHLQERRVAFSRDVDKLLALANEYYELTR